VGLTVDLFSAVGGLVLVNADAAQLEADIAEVRQMEKDGLFEFEDDNISISTESSETKASSIVVIVDPVSTGGAVAFEAHLRGHGVIAVWCNELMDDMRSHIPDCCKTAGFKFYAEIEEGCSIEATAAAVKEAAGETPIAACIVGGETGVTLADKLSLELGVRSNGVLSSGDRRNKSVQQKAVKAAGLRAVREALGTEWAEVEAFVDSESFPVVVKPVESCGSDGVKLCKTKEETRDHFNLLMNSQRKAGAQGAAVLCQEFLKGKEYVVDHVSCNGVHKTVMVWVYDKRPTNGGDFVYYGMIPIDSASEEAQVLITYTRAVLDALKLDNGPTHGEVMMTADGPCLVEMNCRSHGWDGFWVPLARALTGGYAQPEVALDSHMNEQAFCQIPDVMPSPFKASGQTVMLVSNFSGTVAATPGYDRMQKLASFVALQTGVKVGSKVGLTVDLFSAVGGLVLVNADAAQLEADIAEVRQIEQDGLFEFEEDGEGEL
jgi:biotin carboxylase